MWKISRGKKKLSISNFRWRTKVRTNGNAKGFKIHIAKPCVVPTWQYFFNKGSALAQIIFIPYHLGPSILAHPQQLQFQNEHGKFSSGSSGNSEQVQSVQVKSQFRDNYPKAECPLCGHSPVVDPSNFGSARQDDRSTTQVLIDLLEQLRIAESSNLRLPEVGCDKNEAWTTGNQIV